MQENVGEALQVLQAVDRDALTKMAEPHVEQTVWQMAQDIQATLKAGNKVFMAGCGATGRLSLVLETLFRQQFPGCEQVFSFMAGGDYALIKSVERFEDRVEYGERQLTDLGFGDQDLLLASTEGGETAFVIGACNLAATLSNRAPYFLYCNPDDLLMSIQRSREVLENAKIHKVNLTTGPQGISGSTRMQASTVLMLAIGAGLLYGDEHCKDQAGFSRFYQNFLQRLAHTAKYEVMAGLTSLEARLYQDKKFVNYVADPRLAISILTDTTERSPTFSLRGFENRLDAEGGSSSLQHSLSYLFIEGSESAEQAWRKLLCRAPRALEWAELNGRIGLSKVMGFDISQQGLVARSREVECVNFVVSHSDDGRIQLACQDERVEFNWGQDPLRGITGLQSNS